jgi:hypothetical protein
METEQNKKIDTSRLDSTNKENNRFIVNTKRIQEIERINKLNELENPQESEDNRDILSIDTEIVKKILLSWGGGSDGFKLYFDNEKNLLRGVYFMSDWGVYEESELNNEESELIYNFYMGGEFF